MDALVIMGVVVTSPCKIRKPNGALSMYKPLVTPALPELETDTFITLRSVDDLEILVLL